MSIPSSSITETASKRTFVGFVPANDPRLVALVLIDEPESQVYGGVVAAPVFRNLIQGALRRLAVAPQTAQPLPTATNRPESAIRHDVKRAQQATLHAGADGAPDFVGLSLREALAKAQSMKVKVRLQGSGYVVRQAPEAGVRWTEDEVLVLNLQG